MNIVITGATKGIGRAIATKFAGEGHQLAICARTTKDVNRLKGDLLKLNPKANVIAETCDMSEKVQVQAFASKINRQWKRVDVLVNNAGLFLPGQIHAEEDGQLENLMKVNLHSAYHMTRALLTGMMKRQSGHIFNLCSVASFMAYENGGSYSIAKHALLGFSKSLREEMKPHGIRVTSVMPGAVKTPSWDGVDLPEDRFMKPEDIADTIYGIWELSERTVVEEIVFRPQLGDI